MEPAAAGSMTDDPDGDAMSGARLRPSEARGPSGLARQLVARVPASLVVMATNSGWLLTSTAMRLLVGFVTTIWLTRYLGPESFGLYS